MKKLILVGSLFASSFSFGQFLVLDAETKLMYKVEELESGEKGTGFLISSEGEVPVDPEAIRVLSNNDPNYIGPWKIITGPAMRTSHNAPGTQQVDGYKFCAGTNNWPCMIVKKTVE